MKKKIVGILVCTLLIAASTVVIADWDPEDGHKMHFPQLPDPNGWDVNALNELADDWQCSETGYVKDIHFWGSWLDDIVGTINSFKIAIYTNDPGPPSKPKDLKWDRVITDWERRGPYYGDQGFYFPEDDYYEWHNHQQYWQYNVFLDEPWLLQEEGTIYWLGITANVQGGVWGWKSSKFHFEDDAVWRSPTGQWIEMYEPEPPVQNQFWFTMIEREPVEAGGTDYFDDGTSLNGWYYYPYYYPDWWWWNIWFYNAPFSYEKYKEIYVSFICDPMSPDPVFFVINWATDYWEPGGPPPLPRDVPDPQYEDVVIGRWPSGVQPIPVEPGFNEFWFTIPDYNPEWVSIDFMGTSFTIIDGIIIHQCLPPEHGESLDLAFVITGEPADEPSIDIDKLVSADGGVTWSDEVTAALNSKVRFKITVTNDGATDLTDIEVVDTLPVCLEYDNNADPKEPDDITGNVLTWEFAGPLAPSDTIVIEFDAIAKIEGDNVNEVTVTADSDGGSVTDSDDATVIVGQNNPPLKPSKPTGEINGEPGVEYEYKSSTTDPEGQQISYLFDWGDGTNSGWLTPIPSGDIASAKHKWTSKGTYQIKVKARDIPYFAESPYSDPLSVTMPRSRTINPAFFNFLQKFPILQLLLQRLLRQ